VKSASETPPTANFWRKAANPAGAHGHIGLAAFAAHLLEAPPLFAHFSSRLFSKIAVAPLGRCDATEVETLMKQGRSFRHVLRTVAICGGSALAALTALVYCTHDAAAQETSAGRARRTAAQPLDGPNVTNDRDMAVGSMVDSFFEPLTTDSRPVRGATRALGGQPSKASIRPQWTARLARNPKPKDGNPPYVLIDRYGGIQRYIEPVPQIDLEQHIGQTVSVRRDTGHTLLASQLDLPRASSAAGAVAKNSSKLSPSKNVNLAAFEQTAAASPAPTPADGSPLPTPTASPETIPSPHGEIIEGQVIEGEGPMLDANGQPMSVPQGVDPLYLDDQDSGAIEPCPNCGSKLCAMKGGCGFGSRPIFYARGEYLLWYIEGMQIPPLVVEGTADNGDFVDAFVVYGNQRILDSSRSGGRVRLGYWLDDYGRWAVEGEYLGLGQINSHFLDGGNGTFPIVGRPFIDATTGLPAVEDVSFPGIMGTVAVNADSRFQSAGVWLRKSICCTPGCASCGDAVGCGSGVCGGSGCGSGVAGSAPCFSFFQGGTRHIDMVYGVRWAELKEGLDITENLTVIAPSTAPSIGTTFLVNDNFATSNQFIGGEFGFAWDWQRSRWSLELLSKLALGSTRQGVTIRGFTVNTPPGGPSETFNGGLLTQSSNISHYERDMFSVLPQVGLTAGYMLTDRLKLTGGYTFMYWSRVVRPGDQIDPEVNPELIPSQGTTGDGLPARPQFAFRDTDIWIQGINVGLEYQW
jgi:hypothetical protein